jgi:hypothetical protein
MRVVFLTLPVAALIGCTSMSERLQPALARSQHSTPVTCADCTVQWQRSQLWLTAHSKWKLQMATDVVLQTFNPVNDSPSWGFTVTREPESAGGYRIVLAGVCGNIFGCDPSIADVDRAFYHYVATGEDILAGAPVFGAIR